MAQQSGMILFHKNRKIRLQELVLDLKPTFGTVPGNRRPY